MFHQVTQANKIQGITGSIFQMLLLGKPRSFPVNGILGYACLFVSQINQDCMIKLIKTQVEIRVNIVSSWIMNRFRKKTDLNINAAVDNLIIIIKCFGTLKLQSRFPH